MEWTVDQQSAGQRLDVFLSDRAGITRSRAGALIRQGACTVSGALPHKVGQALRLGQTVSFDPPPPVLPSAAPQPIPLDVLYQDQDLAVVFKPSGMVVHPAPGNPDHTLVNALLYHLQDLSGVGGQLRPGIVHRIDKDTSGLIIAAKNDFAHAALAAQLKDHSLARTYVCIVCGKVKDDSGTIDAPIGRHPADRKKMAVTEKNSRSAVTHWRVLERFSGYTLVECKLETGRTHQIRVHMAYRGHPILGDMVYGHKKPELGQDSQCLHAKELRFVHPRTGQLVTVCCELPDYFTALLEKLRARA